MLLPWLQRRTRTTASSPRRPKARRGFARPSLEPLEVRVLPARWTVPIPDGTVWSSTEVQEIGAGASVPAGATLTVLPGTVIKFDSGQGLSVAGTLDAHG